MQTNTDTLATNSTKIRDPNELVVYLVVNTDLKMGIGKTAAQVGHVIHYLGIKRDELLGVIDNYSKAYGNDEHKKLVEQALTFNAWHNSGSVAKVVLAANAADFEIVKTEYADRCVVVCDEGRTEIPSGSETVIGLYPMKKSEASPIIKRLKPLR
jgi:peptidyl-tRNA hydrolase